MKPINKQSIKKINITIFRFILAIIPFIWIFGMVDFSNFWEIRKNIEWWTIPVVSTLFLTSMFLQGFRWWYLIHSLIPQISLKTAISAHFKGIFYSIILPTSAGQDVVRAVILSDSDNYGAVWGSAWLSRIFGLLALSILSLTGIIVTKTIIIPQTVLFSITGSISVVFLLIFLSFTRVLTKKVAPVANKVLPAKIQKTLKKIVNSIYLYRKKKDVLLLVFSTTILVQLFSVLISFFIILGINGEVHLAECLLFVPLIEIISISLPLTPNGLGLREGLSSLFLVKYIGFSPEQVGIFVLISLLGIVMRISGGFVILADYINKRNKK